MNRGSILHDDLTYTMLHEMVMKKFNLEANYPLNLSAKLSSIDDNLDITDDHEVRFFVECACNSKDEVAHLCDTLKGPIQGNKYDSCRHGWKQPNCANYFWYMQRGNRHAAIALAVHNEFPLAYHVVCCRHLMMNLSLKRDKIKALFWKICKAYTTEEFSSSVSHLQDIQPDAYDKLCQVGPQRWSRAHCPLVRYNYLTSNSVESVNACTVVYRKLPVLKLAETYHAMVQDWYYKCHKLA
ncbi:hypothetical protein Tco_0538121, partial [Tanacetum coccineum]